MAEYIEIVPIRDNEEYNSKFTSSIPCYYLANMLTDWEGNCYTEYNTILNDEEIKTIKSSFGKESLSVQEGYTQFTPNIVSVNKLNNALKKIRNNLFFPICNAEAKRSEMRDLIVISECIGFLEFIKNDFSEVYLAVEDC